MGHDREWMRSLTCEVPSASKGLGLETICMRHTFHSYKTKLSKFQITTDICRGDGGSFCNIGSGVNDEMLMMLLLLLLLFFFFFFCFQLPPHCHPLTASDCYHTFGGNIEPGICCWQSPGVAGQLAVGTIV